MESSSEIQEGESSTTAASKPAKGMGRIVRDESGKVIDIIEGEAPSDNEDTEMSNPWGKLGEGGNDNDPQELKDLEKKSALKISGFPKPKGKTNEVIKQLEEMEKSEKPVKRHTSLGKNKWLVDLLEKYGEDYQGMSKDKHLNLLQKTEGEIKRSVKKAGGREMVLKGFESQR